MSSDTTKFDERPGPGDVEIELGMPDPFGDATPAEVIRYAALGAPPGSTDPLDRSIVAEASARVGVPDVTRLFAYQPPAAGQPYALTEVSAGDGVLTIARGDPRALVEDLIRPAAPQHARAIAAKFGLTTRAWRPLGVAVRHGQDPWTLLGYIPVRVWSRAGRHKGQSYDYRMVWDVWLRVSHWTWVAAILVLTATGFMIADPGFVPSALTDTGSVGYFMGYIRFTHLIAAVVLVLVIVVRVWNLSTSRLPYDRWPALIPFRNRSELRNTGRTLLAYLFVRPSTAPEYFGHNPLQQLAYTFIYLMFLVQVVTGMALWGLYDTHNWFWGSWQWPNVLFGVQQVRLLHYVTMWIILVFLPLHVYLSIRADNVDRSGAISSMVSGGRWIRRGAHFVDWPPRHGGAGESPRPDRAGTPKA